MAQNTGKPYELLVQQILDQILNESNTNNIKVNHNISLQGKDATHQIDLYWEFEIGGIKYSTVVEVKDLIKPVDQGKLFQFKCVLDDLPGQPRGIFVTRTGYQEGAREYAKKNGILLYELREPTDQDWDDRIKTFNIEINLYNPKFDNIKLIQDTECNIQELKRLNIPHSEASKISIEVSDNLKFYDESGAEITTAFILFNSLVPKGFNELQPTKVTYRFDRPTFIKTSNPQVRMWINSLEITISKTLETKTIILKGEDFVQYVLKNISDGNIRTIPKNSQE